MTKLLTLLLIFATISLNAQNKGSILFQDFETDYSDWTITAGTGETSWTVGNDASSYFWTVPAHTIYAYANDDLENGDMSDAWLISPTFDLSQTLLPKLTFEYINEIGIGGVSKIKISTDGGTSWADLQTLPSQSNWTSAEISLLSYKQNNVKIAFHFNDQGSSVYGFLVDDIKVVNILSHDLGIKNVVPNFAFKNNTITPNITVESFSQNDENDYDVSIVIKDADGNELYNHTKNFTNTIATDETFVAEMDDSWTPASDGNYIVTATITLANDDNQNNNSVTQNFIVGYKPATIYTYNSEDNKTGILPITCGSFQTLEYSGNPGYWFFSCADNINGKIYAIENGSKKVFLIPANGNIQQVGTITDGSIGNVIGITHDAVNDVVYILDRQSSSSNLYTLNMNSFIVSPIGQIATNTIISIGADANGNLYGVDNVDDKLISIDKTTGAATAIGSIGIDIGWADIGCDRDNNIMYATTYNNTEHGKIGTIDLTTGTFTELSSVSQDLTMCAVSSGDLTEYTAEFTVLDGNSDPAQNALVTIQATCGDETKITDSQGIATIDLISGSYLYSVTYNGCDTYNGSITIDGGNVNETVNLSCTSKINDISENQISIFPNPTTGQFTIDLRGSATPRSVEITDITGKTIKQLSINNNKLTIINIENQPAGIYFIKIQTENNIIIKKIIKK